MSLFHPPGHARADEVLLDAPSANLSYFGMYCEQPCLAASFTLTADRYVSAIAVVLRTTPDTSFDTFTFSLQDSQSAPITTIATGVVTAERGAVSTQAFQVDKTLAPGTYYLVGFIPGYYGTPVTPGNVNGWYLSNGNYSNTAGQVTDGVWFGPSVLNTDHPAPAFTVYGELGPTSTTSTTIPLAGSGTIAGTVLAEPADGGPTPLAGAMVEVCSGVCQLVVSGADGGFQVGPVPAGAYTLRGFPPDLSPLLPAERGPITVAPGQLLAGQDLLLRRARPYTPAAEITNADPAADGIPSVYWHDPLDLRATGCPGASAGYEVRRGSRVLRSGSLIEQTPGTFVATIPPLYPTTGTAEVVVVFACPGSSEQRLTFDIYIDPSGMVVDQTGAPVANATVTLLRADQPGGPFEVVPDGSPLMSPANRRNPDQSRADGRFGWDVLAGYYVVRAERPGCTAPGGGSSTVETAVLAVPPPATDLLLQLQCLEDDCGNCRDDDGDGAVDLEDADCCAGGTTPLTLTTAALTVREGGGSRIRLTGSAAWAFARRPAPIAVRVQLRSEEAGTPPVCAMWPASAFQRRKRALRLRRSAAVHGLTTVTLQAKGTRAVGLVLGGERSTLAVSSPGALRVTVAIDDGAGDLRCSGAQVALRPARRKGLRFP